MQFCNQCGGPIEGAPANCPHCGAVRNQSAPVITSTPPTGTGSIPPPEAVAEGIPDDTAYFTPPPTFGAPDPAPDALPATGPLADDGPLAPDTRYSSPPPPDYAPPANGAPAEPVPTFTPPPTAAPAPAPPPAAAPPAGDLDTRPEIREILTRILGERYNFVREVGAGGMSIVYEMEDTILQTHVAVKVLYPELAINPEVANRFKNEAVITAKLTGNPHIIKVYDYGYKERVHYIITQFLSGQTLRDEMKSRFGRNEKFDWREAAEIMIAVGKALESVHEKSVVHRDIKPGNVIFENGQPVLIDFGIAKIPQEQQGKEWLVTTQAGMSLGTPHYISPEEAQGLGSTPKSDIYSLGVMFYEMVTGRVPFDGESAQQIMIDHVTKEPDDPTLYNSNLPSHIAQIVLKLLRKDPNQRLTASELVGNLEAQLGISSRGSSAAAASVAPGGGSSSGSSGGGGKQQVEGATVVAKSVMKGKATAGKGGGKTSPLTILLVVLAVGGLGYILAEPYLAGGGETVVEEPVEKTAKIVDTVEAEMSKLYDEAVVDLGERKYKTAHEKFRKVYAWNNRWRNVEPAYFSTKHFLEGRKAYLSGRSRASFEKAAEFFHKADETFRGVFARPFPFATEYKLASQQMSDAIGAENAAKSAGGDAKTKALWDAQRSYQSVTEQIPWEAGAYFSRLDNLISYWNEMVRAKNAEGEKRAVAQIQATIDEGLVGLEDDKENLLRLYETWAIPIYRDLIKDPARADELAQDAAQERRAWEAAGKPGLDAEDEAEAAAVGNPADSDDLDDSGTDSVQ